MHSGPTNANRAAAGGVGALVAVVAMWVLSAYAGVNPPTEVAGAAGALIAQVVNAVWSRIGGIG
jgi:putative flippase GtrA